MTNCWPAQKPWRLRLATVLAAVVILASSGCDRAAPAATTSASGAAASSESASPGVGQPVKIATHGTPHALELRSNSPPPVREITFDTIKLDMQKGDPFQRSLLTPAILALDGKPIRIRGYILPSFQQTGITQFVLVRDNLQCCFGPGAALHDCIVVEMQPGKSADYTVRPVTVRGTFAIRELLASDGKHLAIYHLAGEKVD